MEKNTGRRSSAGKLSRTEPRIFWLATLIAGQAVAEMQLASTETLKRLSIEELMAVEVTSVSRAPQSLSSAPAAVTVISNDDIRRSGATTVPGALRMTPGIHVARLSSSAWAV